MVTVSVRENNVDQALKVLKKKLQREGVFREMKLRRDYEKPSEKRKREKAELSVGGASLIASAKIATGRNRSPFLPENIIKHLQTGNRRRCFFVPKAILVDFRQKGLLPNYTAETKRFVDGSTVDIYQTDYRPQENGIVYSFSTRRKDQNFTSHINFQLNAATQDCIGISGLKDPGMTCISHTTLDFQSPRQIAAEELFSDFLQSLRNVFTGSGMVALIEDTLAEADKTLSHLPSTVPATKVPALVP